MLINNSTFTAYAIYDAAAGRVDNTAKLEAVLLLNLNVWNSTSDPATRPYIEVNLPKNVVLASTRSKRLTALGADTYQNITWAEQYVTAGGHINGTQRLEKLVDHSVLVGASEALLVKF
jgi:hypothetical protein